MRLAFSKEELGWGTLVEVGPGEIYSDESLLDLVGYHAQMVRGFVAQGAALVIGRRYVDDKGFEPEAWALLNAALAEPTELEASGSPNEVGLPLGLFVARATLDLANHLDLEYAIGNVSLFVFRGFDPQPGPDVAPFEVPSMKSALSTPDGRRRLCDYCQELIYFSSDGEYLLSLSRDDPVRDWLPTYADRIAKIGAEAEERDNNST